MFTECAPGELRTRVKLAEVSVVEPPHSDTPAPLTYGRTDLHAARVDTAVPPVRYVEGDRLRRSTIFSVYYGERTSRVARSCPRRSTRTRSRR